MAGLTRDQVVAIAKALLGERSDLFWSVTEQNTLADVANRQVFELLVQAQPEHFLAIASYSWPASTEYVDITTVLGAEPYRIVQIESMALTGAVTSQNVPRVWEPMSLSARATYLRRTDGYHYCLHGGRIYLAPIPTAAVNAQVFWIAQLVALASGSTEVLAGFAEPWGHSVAVCLAHLMNASQQGSNGAIEAAWAAEQLRMKATAGRRHTGSGRIRSVRRV